MKTKKIQDMLAALNDAQEKSSELSVSLQRSIAEGKILAANLQQQQEDNKSLELKTQQLETELQETKAQHKIIS